MANWCSTNIDIKCKKQDSAEKIYESFKKWLKSTKEGITDGWIGNLLLNSGMMNSVEEIEKDYETRGTVTDLSVCSDTVLLYTETAWVPMLKAIRDVLDHFFYDDVTDFWYTATEPGCEVYCSNDPDVAEKYVLETDDSLYPDEWFEEADAIKTLTECLKTKGIETSSKTIEELQKEYDYLGIDLSVHQYDYIEEYELD